MEIKNIDWEFGSFKIPVTFYKQMIPKGLLIVFPGGGYPCVGPVLYYPTNLYIDNSYNVLTLEYDFKRFNFDGDRDFFLKELGIFIFQKILNEFDDGHIHLLAKSIGTRIIALSYEFMEKEFERRIQKVVLLTPTWNQLNILDKLLPIGSKSFHVIGTADNLYLKQTEKSLSDKGIKFLTIPKADHGLDIEGNVSESILILGNLTEEIRQFVEVF